MQILSLKLHNFRCFNQLELDFNSKIVLITGPNGSGKTSILEALHYLCYLRSFKTHLFKELINLDLQINSSFSINANLAAPAGLGIDTLQIVSSQSKRTVKLNQQAISSYKEIYDTYKAVTIDEDDLMLIRGTPEFRRSFIDQFIALLDPTYINVLKKYKVILGNRNALLNNYKNDYDSYLLWSEQLFNLSTIIQKKRVEILEILQKEILGLISEILGLNAEISISYQYARPYTSIHKFSNTTDFIDNYPNLLHNETTQGRTLFGAHLDDFKITFDERHSKAFASRGQQKLIVFLLKFAQIRHINNVSSSLIGNLSKSGPVLLIDDFLTDFDDSKIDMLLKLIIGLSGQVIITSPLANSLLEQKLSFFNIQIINLENNKMLSINNQKEEILY